MRRTWWVLPLLVLGTASCARVGARTHMRAGEWAERARALAADSSWLADADAVYRAGVLHGTPGRPTYDPELARTLFQRVVDHFPGSARATEAAERLALLDEVIALRSELRQIREIDLARQRSRQP